MTDTQVKIGNALLRGLVQLKENKGHLDIEDVGDLFENIAASLTQGSSIDTYVRGEIEKMARYISHAMDEISSISIDHVDPDKAENPLQNLCLASAELNAVAKATEHATHDILDAADVIQAKLGELGTNKDAVKAIQEATTKIYHACNFQDITGQRIAKVLGTFEFLQTKINNLKKLFDGNGENVVPVKGTKTDKRSDAKLMTGPQLEAPSQDQIDKLFANLK